MSRYDYQDPGTDPAYCDGLQADELDVTPVEESLIDTQRHLGTLGDQLDELIRCVEALVAERQHIVSVLCAFSRAPISMASLQPVLDLAAELEKTR